MKVTHALTGMVTEWRPEGYGFASFEELGSQSCFIHCRQLVNGQPKTGDAVRIEGAKRGTRGWRAIGLCELLDD